jgi:hypothetical protein
MIGVGIPLIIYFVSNFNSRREKLLSEMKALYPKFNSFRELIYLISLLDLWKNKAVVKQYERALLKGDKKEMDVLNNENEFLTLYKTYRFIGNQYSADNVNNYKRSYSYKEIIEYQNHANKIWYSIDCRKDFIIEINQDCFLNLNNFELERIRKVISKIDQEFVNKKITIELIANIAGEMEATIIDALADLAWNYERPLEPFVKKLYGIMAISLFFGVIAPLILLTFSPIYAFLAALIIVFITIICFSTLVLLTGKYMGLY